MSLYSAKLTAEPFLYAETKIIAEYLLDGYDKASLKNKNIEENLIKYKSPKSITRINSPIFRRLEVLNEDMLYEFVNGDVQTSKLLLLYAIMKTDNLVNDFMVDVYKDKVLLGKKYIEQIEVDDWFQSKLLCDRSLNEKTDSTKLKLKQVLMKIINDSGVVTREKDRFKINKIIIKNHFKDFFKDSDEEKYIKVFGGFLWET